MSFKQIEKALDDFEKEMLDWLEPNPEDQASFNIMFQRLKDKIKGK